jgi:hypothetical protein
MNSGLDHHLHILPVCEKSFISAWFQYFCNLMHQFSCRALWTACSALISWDL